MAEDLSRVDDICRVNPPPAKQFNGAKKINKNQPLRRCQEWTSETIGSLRAEGVLLDQVPDAPGPSSGAIGSQGTEPGGGETRDGGWHWSVEYERWYRENDDGSCEWS